MATTKAKGQGKSEFLKELLGRSPDTNMKGVLEAWKKAGNKGTISNPLFYIIRSEMKSKGTKQPNDGETAGSSTPRKPKMTSTKNSRPKRSEFLRALFGSRPEANLKEANEAWKKAGNPGTISSTLMYLIKSQTNAKAQKPSDLPPHSPRPEPDGKPL